MQRLQAYQYELMPSGDQRRDMRRFAGSSRFVLNKALALQTANHAAGNMDRAFTNFFEKRAEHPRFKKRGFRDSFRFPQGFKLDQLNSRVYLPKLGWVRYRNSREVLGTVKNITVSNRNGKWFVSIQTEREVEQPVAHGDAVGIDMGVARLATLSDGTVCPPLNTFRRYAADLGKAQQAMSRKKKFSAISSNISIPTFTRFWSLIAQNSAGSNP
jgi:putative transposase